MNNQEAIALFEKHEFNCQECACWGECNKVNCKDKQAFDLAIKALKLYPFMLSEQDAAAADP